MDELERSSHSEMRTLYDNARNQCQYTATRFLAMVEDLGGRDAAKKLLRAADVSDGFTALWECDCLHLTVEALVLKSPWSSLFTEGELAVARQRLTDAGFKVQ